MKQLKLSLLLLALFTVTQLTNAQSALWSHKPTQDIKWYQVADAGVVIVGTDKNVYALDPDSGVQLWTRDDLSGIAEYEVNQIKNTPILFISDPKGFGNAKTKLHAVDVLTGKSIWETGEVQGHAVETAVNYDKGIALIITVVNKMANKDKLDLYAVRISNGKLLWKTEYTEKVDLYGKEKGSRFMPTFDLSGANPPVFDQDAVYLSYAGLHKFNLADGKLIWKAPYDVTEGGIKRGNAQIILAGDTVYTSAKGQMRAIDKNSGAQKWISKDFGAGVAETISDGATIYGRLGGHFYDYNKREYVKKTPFGVVAIEAASGNMIWKYEGAKNNITNLALVKEANTLLIADEKNLIGLDLSAQGKVKEAYKLKLEFKNKIGAAARVAKIGKIGFGALSGGVMGGIKGSKGGADGTDDPVQITRRENGTYVIRGVQHILAFNPQARSIAWATEYEAPSAPAWQKIVMGSLTLAAAYVSLSTSVNSQAMMGYKTDTAERAENNMIASFNSFEKWMTKRYSNTKSQGNYTYVMTNVALGADGKDKGPGIVGINMVTGEGERQIQFNDKDPDYEIDELLGRVFNLKNPKELSAFAIR
jgi:outer membrane protein assembly factor BamB